MGRAAELLGLAAANSIRVVDFQLGNLDLDPWVIAIPSGSIFNATSLFGPAATTP